MPFAPQKRGHLALHVDDVAAARAALEEKGIEFAGDTFDTGVCHMALFADPDGNSLMLHHRYARAPEPRPHGRASSAARGGLRRASPPRPLRPPADFAPAPAVP